MGCGSTHGLWQVAKRRLWQHGPWKHGPVRMMASWALAIVAAWVALQRWQPVARGEHGLVASGIAGCGRVCGGACCGQRQHRQWHR
eukprot:13294521-Alexandrium_andersonii.AAC.1